MQFTVSEIAALLGGTTQGNDKRIVKGLGKIESATNTDIAFLANPKYEDFIYSTQAAAVIVNQAFKAKKPVSASLIIVADSYSAFTALLEQYQRLRTFSKTGIEPNSFIHESVKHGQDLYLASFAYISKNCQLGDRVKIFPNVFIGENVKIGNEVVIYSGAKIMSETIIGNNCTIQPGAVIGSDGFGFAPQADGTYKTIPQIGNVVIEDHVDVGANTVIDRATMGSTIIRKGVKLDNLIQIAHNVEVGEHTVIAAQAGVSGSSKIGSNCMIGGQVGISGHISIANKTGIGAQSGIAQSIKAEGQEVIGSPAIELSNFFRSSVLFRKLPDINKAVQDLQQQVQKNK